MVATVRAPPPAPALPCSWLPRFPPGSRAPLPCPLRGPSIFPQIAALVPLLSGAAPLRSLACAGEARDAALPLPLALHCPSSSPTLHHPSTSTWGHAAGLPLLPRRCDLVVPCLAVARRALRPIRRRRLHQHWTCSRRHHPKHRLQDGCLGLNMVAVQQIHDGIYPNWAVFVKSISLPITDKDKLFAEQQESKRKNIERAFGVLQRRFCILKRPARLYDRGELEQVVLACIILHNMIVEDEKEEEIEEDLDLNEAPSTTTVEAPELSPEDYVTFDRVCELDADIRDSSTHFQLKRDLVEHIWQRSRHN